MPPRVGRPRWTSRSPVGAVVDLFGTQPLEGALAKTRQFGESLPSDPRVVSRRAGDPGAPREWGRWCHELCSRAIGSCGVYDGCFLVSRSHSSRQRFATFLGHALYSGYNRCPRRTFLRRIAACRTR